MSWLKETGPPAVGYWGPVTATLDWCEKNYEWSKYVAEPANTFSNLFFIFLAVYGAYQVRKQKLPWRFWLCNLGIAIVGMGSFMFHASLRYDAQLLDELPMVYTSTLLTYCVCETSKGYGKPRFPILLPGILLASATGITVGYLKLGNPVFHQVAYASIQLFSTLRVLYLLYSSSSPLAISGTAIQKRGQMRRLYVWGSAIFLSGFGVWNIDNIFCGWLREARSIVGYPWALALEGHSWWHLLTGYGAYYLVVACEFLVLSLKEHPDNFILQGSFLPRVVRVKPYNPAKIPGTNGSAVTGKAEKSL